MNTTKNSSLYSNVSNCIICLDEVRCRGKLSVCKHWFCFGCILEWSKNTNTCPVCKTRFRSIAKVHLSPLKSPPTKVRVPDKDQQVWIDDDDDGVTEEMLYDIQNELREDMDDDYEPPYMSYQYDLDEYDLEDSFIDDSSLSQPSNHTPERFFLAQELMEEEYAFVTRNSPYMLRRRSRRRGPSTRGSDVMIDIYALNNIEEDTVFEDISSDESCDSSSTDSSLSDADEGHESSQRTKSTRSSRNTRSQDPRRSIRSQVPRRSTRSQPPTRNARSQASNRSTRSQARLQKEQARNKRQRQDQSIAQNIQETGSSGWLNTRSTNELAAAASAATAITQITNHNSSPRHTLEDTAGSSHGRARHQYTLRTRNDDDDDDDDTIDSDKSGNSPLRISVARVKEGTHSCPRKSSFSRIRVLSSSESELSDFVVLTSPTKPNSQQKSTGSDNRNSAVPRDMEMSLPSSSYVVEDDETNCNQNEVKKWKRIRNGKKEKGKENKPLPRSLFSQNASAASSNDPDFIPNSSDELPSKRCRLGTISNRNVNEHQESSSTTSRVTRAQIQRLKNNYPLVIDLKGSSSSSQSSSLIPEGVNNRCLLRTRSQGNHNDSDDDDYDSDRDSDTDYTGKRTRYSKTTKMPSDELPSKRCRLGTISNRNVNEHQESSSTTSRVTRAQIQRLKNNYFPLGINVKGSSSSSQSSSLIPEGVNNRYLLRTRSQGNQNNSDDYDYDSDRDSDTEYTGKRTRNSTIIRMPHDYKDDTTDDDERKSEGKGNRKKMTVNRAQDRDAGEHFGKGKLKQTTMSRLQKCSDITDDDDDDDYRVSTGKDKTFSVTWLRGKPSTHDDDDDYIMGDEQPNLIIPTPQPDKKRSIFTRRQHRIILEQFDDLSNNHNNPPYDRHLQTQYHLAKSSNKTKPSDDENQKSRTKAMPCRASGMQLVKDKVFNDDVTPESSGSNGMSGSYSSNKPTVTRTRRRIKVYDSDSD